MTTTTTSPKFKVYGRKDIDTLPHFQKLTADQRMAIKAVSAVLPFRVNDYVLDQLIDWNNLPNDPIYQLTIPQPEMLHKEDLERMLQAVSSESGTDGCKNIAREIQNKMNPNPALQKSLNVPKLGDERVPGMQHKYRETALFFPSQGQTCHAYCTYCFRWAQFVGQESLRFASKEAVQLTNYLRAHKEITSVLFTGGDPAIMKTTLLRRYIEPLLTPEFEHIKSIRIGTKALAYWPYRFTTDNDADDLMRLFEEVRASGRNMAIMAHYSHPKELEPEDGLRAVRRIIDTGATIRAQAPLIRHVNDDSNVWEEMWRKQVSLGIIPYYMFVERDTGPKDYFGVPLAEALTIFQKAYRQVTGLARTVRGPSMSASPGKVLVTDAPTINGQKLFALKFLQARNPEWVGRLFFAEYDTKAAWLHELKPAFGEKRFFYEDEMDQIVERGWAPNWPVE
ncbi:lysine 2,3-aminomutase [Myxococcota bacterium]|nr:lysine 2,3-aminomutase [Myxococcota bacterium]